MYYKSTYHVLLHLDWPRFPVNTVELAFVGNVRHRLELYDQVHPGHLLLTHLRNSKTQLDMNEITFFQGSSILNSKSNYCFFQVVLLSEIILSDFRKEILFASIDTNLLADSLIMLGTSK